MPKSEESTSITNGHLGPGWARMGVQVNKGFRCENTNVNSSAQPKGLRVDIRLVKGAKRELHPQLNR